MITTYLNTARKKIWNLFLFDGHSKSQILCQNIRGIRKFTTKIGGIKLERHVIGTCSRRKKKKEMHYTHLEHKACLEYEGKQIMEDFRIPKLKI